MKGWIGVDLDGTLARYDGWVDHMTIGEPIPRMVNRVKKWLAEGMDVRIFTARVVRADELPTTPIEVIQDWTEKHIGARLPVTGSKDYGMIELWDDRAVTVIPNTGRAWNERE
jgi:hypothetical protein